VTRHSRDADDEEEEEDKEMMRTRKSRKTEKVCSIFKHHVTQDIRLYSKSSLTLKEWRSKLSFP
jgi:hypothetical protein